MYIIIIIKKETVHKCLRKKKEKKRRRRKKEEERTDHKFLWHRKKDQTTNVDGKRKMASKQLTPNETNKTAETTSKTQTVAYLQTQGGKNTTKSQQSNRLLSATNEWTTTLTIFVAAIRAQSKNNCADKQMESQTNHN